MAGSILAPYRWQVFYNGTPAAGALLYSYLSGGSTAQALYADSALGSALTNPIQADTNGVFPIMYMAAVAYRITITTSDGTTIFAAQDHIYDLWQIFAATTQTASTVYAGPTSGSAAAPTFRALVSADLPVATLNVGTCEGRLSLTTATPVTAGDVTAATTIYFPPYLGNRIALYDGSSAWTLLSFTEKTIAVPATTSQMYDVFGYNNSGTLALELAAWTNDTTRATALTTQDGVYVKTGATTRRYLGSFRTTGVSGQTEDSLAKRFVWNYYNRVSRPLLVAEGTANWTYTTATIRQVNGSAANQIAIVVGVAESPVIVNGSTIMSNTNTGVDVQSGIGDNSTTAYASNGVSQVISAIANGYLPILTRYQVIPTVGYHPYMLLEESTATGTTTWHGTDLASPTWIAGQWWG